ncbi:hypothetical protein IWZ00DRAFT_225357 [Phyllosticta capitalensis]|uniref:Uncharacterized protein n=1 Tax=Phyllosticta capitalensis TaxID=121624 RepID=A0ABR1YRS0_9PEZI
MAYVPPALRKKQQAAESTADGAVQDVSVKTPPRTRGFPRDSLPRADDVYEHFWPLDSAVQTAGGTSTTKSTLHSSAAEPDILRYVVLYYEANPRWASDKIIFAKTNIHLLPGAPKQSSAVVEEEQKSSTENTERIQGNGQESTRDRSSSGQDTAPQVRPPTIAATESSDKPNPGAIAVFEQIGSHGGGMKFIGYHKLANVQFLEPRSADLVRMLEQKWSRPDKYGHVRQVRRDSDKWQESLGYRWAVIKLEEDEEANKKLAPPDIKINAEREINPNRNKGRTPQKSVNDMLREMRLGNNEAQDGEATTASDDKPA